jgi:HTH-type transcriptional regulator/antitoxin HigA
MNMIDLVKASHAIKDTIPFSDIKSKDDYNTAMEIMEAITNDYDDNLSVIVDLLAPKIVAYEDSLEELEEFNARVSGMESGSTMLRLLMEHHNLKTTDFKDEIGVKSVVSMIANGKRRLTVEHIRNLSSRFEINPSLFF